MSSCSWFVASLDRLYREVWSVELALGEPYCNLERRGNEEERRVIQSDEAYISETIPREPRVAFAWEILSFVIFVHV